MDRSRQMNQIQIGNYLIKHHKGQTEVNNIPIPIDALIEKYLKTMEMDTMDNFQVTKNNAGQVFAHYELPDNKGRIQHLIPSYQTFVQDYLNQHLDNIRRFINHFEDNSIDVLLNDKSAMDLLIWIDAPNSDIIPGFSYTKEEAITQQRLAIIKGYNEKYQTDFTLQEILYGESIYG